MIPGRHDPFARRAVPVMVFLAAIFGGGMIDPAIGRTPGGGEGRGVPPLHRGRTQWLGRLVDTTANPAAASGIKGTDLGVSFRWGERLCFLFGDCRTMDPLDPGAGRDDAAAFATLPSPRDAWHLPLAWILGPSGRFRPIRVEDMRFGAMEVPVEGIRLSGRTYFFFAQGWDRKAQAHRFSVLAHGEAEDLHDLVVDFRVPTKKFINVSAVTTGGGADGEPRVYLWGTGPFRKSAVYLARVPAARLGDRSAWRYYAGIGPGGPRYSAEEDRARPLFPLKDGGELSVAWHAGLARWILAYNTGRPSRVALRWAPAPHGPWSPPLFIFKPWKDRGYTVFLHVPRSRLGYDDGLSDPGREEEWGGVYGPYLVPSWFEEEGACSWRIRYTLSSWNPYQVHLMETELHTGAAQAGKGAETKDAQEGGDLGEGGEIRNLDFKAGDLGGWQCTGDAFHLVHAAGDPLPWLSTRARGGRPAGALKGTLERWFRVGPKVTGLRFELRGGHGAVKLYWGGNVCYRTFGPGPRAPVLSARWSLAPFRGEKVRLSIEDRYDDPLGYVEVRGFRLEKEGD